MADRGPVVRIEYEQRLTQADFDAFAQLSGDHNPIHVDSGFAAHTPFGTTVAHGMLLFTLLRGVLARHYPGARLQTQELMFPAPSHADDALRIIVRAPDPGADGSLVLQTEIYRSDGQCCLAGRCHLLLADRERP